MAPTQVTQVEHQTELIIAFLLGDNDLEIDGPGDDANGGEGFDPALIANQLRRIADDLDQNVRFQAALNELKKAVAQEAVVAAFSRGVETLYQTYVSPEMAKEMQLIKATVSFGLYVKSSAPEMTHKVRSAMTAFLNMRVGAWVAQQGGWVEVTNV